METPTQTFLDLSLSSGTHIPPPAEGGNQPVRRETAYVSCILLRPVPSFAASLLLCWPPPGLSMPDPYHVHAAARVR